MGKVTHRATESNFCLLIKKCAVFFFFFKNVNKIYIVGGGFQRVVNTRHYAINPSFLLSLKFNLTAGTNVNALILTDLQKQNKTKHSNKHTLKTVQ